MKCVSQDHALEDVLYEVCLLLLSGTRACGVEWSGRLVWAGCLSKMGKLLIVLGVVGRNLFRVLDLFGGICLGFWICSGKLADCVDVCLRVDVCERACMCVCAR